jgi:Fuc2NAc and GlcNAc transferase
VTRAWIFPAVLIASALLTGAVRRYALTRRLIDHPNARSSHAVATPRGGGVAIVLSSLCGLALLAQGGLLPWPTLWALAGAGSLVALVGFLDDHGHVAARWRLLAHALAAGWLLYWMGGAPAIGLLGLSLPAGVILQALAVLYLVWVLNLYNFMDGIDGIASVEAITVCLAGALLYVLVDARDAAAAPVLLAMAVAGFLFWNFPPARIFMGDAGSGFLGIVVAGLSLQAAWTAPQLFWSWTILLGVFIVDATYTLIRRLTRGERPHEAHRSHAYQHASRRFGRHLPVTLAVGAINLFWLLPIACWVGAGGLDGFLGTLVAYAPLLALAVGFRAGEPELGEAG